MSIYDKYIGEIDPSMAEKDTPPENTKKTALTFLLVTIGIVIIGFMQTPAFQNRVEYKATKQLAKILDAQLADSKTLPEDLKEISTDGINLNSIIYSKISDDEYEIKFTTRQGIEAIYSSITHDWN